MPPKFFPSAAEWRTWLEANHAKVTELLVGFQKRNSGRPGMTWSESVDEALCFGWIDGVVKSIDESTYCKRYTVRKSGSIWSKVNIAKAESLIAAGRMTEAGLIKFRQRSSARSGIYAYEQSAAELDAESATEFKENPGAWEFFLKQTPSYRKVVTWWIVSARQPLTRQKRLARLIEASSNGKPVSAFDQSRYTKGRGRPPRATKK
jgi:uncharacterized protein YdeI (YjbR/CyaY-like superfamily)